MNLKYERISQWWSTRDVQKRLSHRLSRSHTTQLSNNINPAGAGFIMHRTQTHAYYAAADNTTMYRQTDLLPPQPPPLEHISMRPKSAQFGQHAVRNTNTSLNTVGIIVWTILLFFLFQQLRPLHRTQIYRKLKRLGEGSYATVYQCENVFVFSYSFLIIF
jgi:hypothetical protein